MLHTENKVLVSLCSFDICRRNFIPYKLYNLYSDTVVIHNVEAFVSLRHQTWLEWLTRSTIEILNC